MAAFYRCNRMTGAPSMRNGNATASLFSVFLRHYCTTNALLHIDSAIVAKDWKARPGESCLRSAGRICEVGPPQRGLSFFTSPYSHFVLNGASCSARPDGYRRQSSHPAKREMNF
jgi:hypothetical protein